MIICLGATPALQRVMTFQGLTLDEVNRAAVTTASIAGKSINVAKVLSALGEKVIATGFVGGIPGETLRQELDRRGIAHDFVNVASPTRTCITIIDRNTGAQTELVEESQAVDPMAYEQLFQKLDSVLPGAHVLVLSGTLTPDAPLGFYARCTQLARRHRVRVLIDAHGVELIEAIRHGANLVKPNRSELARMLNVDPQDSAALRQAATTLFASHRTTAVITLGREGAWAFDADQWFTITIPQVRAVNAIGSGDAVAAGLAAAIARGQSFEDALRLGMACGVANALTELAGEVRSDDVQGLVPQIRIIEE